MLHKFLLSLTPNKGCPLCVGNQTLPHPLPPFPFFSPWAGQLLSSLPMGGKKGKGERGWGRVWLRAHNGQPVFGVSESKNVCSIQALFLLKTQSPQLVGCCWCRCGVVWGMKGSCVFYYPKQRVLCKQKIQCPSPFPFPPFLTMGRPAAQQPAHG